MSIKGFTVEGQDYQYNYPDLDNKPELTPEAIGAASQEDFDALEEKVDALKSTSYNLLDPTGITPYQSTARAELTRTGFVIRNTTEATYSRGYLYLDLKPNTEYTFSLKKHTTSGVAYVGYSEAPAEGEPFPSVNISLISRTAPDDETITKTFTTTTGILVIRFYATWDTAELGEVEYSEIMVVEGTDAKPYVRHVFAQDDEARNRVEDAEEKLTKLNELTGEVDDLKSAVDDVEYDVGILKSFHKNDLTWAQIKNIVQTGHAQDWFQIGDQIEVNWTKGSTRHSLPFDVVSFDPVIKEGSSDPVPGLWLQSHYAMDGVQFDASEAIYVTTVALPAGTYNFTIGTNWGTHCVAGKVYQFTTTQEVPAGGQIMVGKNNDWYTWGAPDQDPANWRVHTFASNAATTPLESNLTLTEGSEGTALGSIASNTKYSDSGVNNLQRAGYGYNRWSMSAMRQYLNSDKVKDAWWIPQNPFDRAPQQLATLDGFMTGFDLDFLSVLGKVKVTTALNTVSDTDIGASEDTYDTFFLASLEQEYIAPQAAGVEGAYWPYWKERLGLNSPQAQGSDGANVNHIRYAYDARTSAQYCRLRSANRGNATNTWYVNTSGHANHNAATTANRGCPACVIC